MSVHSILSSIRPMSLQWVTRLVLPLIVSVLVITTTGCSMVMGIFGPSEADITGVEAEPTRLLQPTPAGQRPVSAAERELRNGPTPTPFVMRPATQVPPAVTYAETNGSVLNMPGEQSEIRVVITGDSVNLRNAPGLDTQVVATLPRDTTFDYVDETAAGDWVQVCCVQNQLAWIYADLVTKEQGKAMSNAQPASSQSNNALALKTQTNLGQSNSAFTQVGNSTQAENSTTGNGMQTIAQALTAGGTSSLGLSSTNGPTQYRSVEDGYSITLPATWLPLAESSSVINASISALKSENPAMATLLEDQLSLLDDIPISLIAFDLAPETLSSGFATNLNVMKQPVPAGFSLDYLVQFSAEQLEQVLGLSDAAESTHVVLPAGETIILDYQLSNQAIARQYYLMHNQALYIATFSASASLADSSITLFNELMQSFTFDN